MRLAVIFLRTAVMNEVQYRVNFLVQLVQSVLRLGTGLVVLAVVFQRTTTLGGWTRDELLAVMGVYTMVGGIVWSLIQPNMARLIAEIRDGKLDHVLTKPADAQMLISVRSVDLWRLVDVLVGLVVVVVALVRLRELSAGQVVAFAATLLLGAVIIYCFWLMLATSAFWLVRMNEVEELFGGLMQAGQYPVGIYPGWLKYGLTFLVPLAFAVTVPAEALTSRLRGGTVLGAAALAIAMVVVSRWYFRMGLKRYSGASS